MITRYQRHLMRHALGITQGIPFDKNGNPSRNHFATTEDTFDYPQIIELVHIGFMRPISPPLKSSYSVFVVTKEGMEYLGIIRGYSRGQDQ